MGLEPDRLEQVLEAVLFVSPEPIPMERLWEVFSPEGVDRESVADALARLQGRCEGRGVEVREVGGGYQLRTRPEMAPWLARLQMPKPARFSRPAMETLAIVAYRQPATRAEVEEVRGVDCGGVLKTLLEKNLVRIVGKKDVPGRPILYGTTRKFLEVFGLRSLAELPSLRDLDELLSQRAEGVVDGGGAEEEEPGGEAAGDAPAPGGEPDGG